MSLSPRIWVVGNRTPRRACRVALCATWLLWAPLLHAQESSGEEAWSPPILVDAPSVSAQANWQKDDSGLRWVVLRGSKGGVPRAKDVVRVHYVSWLADSGQRFGSSYESGFPLTFSLGDLSVPPGLDLTVRKMRVGERRRVVLPPEQAFGSVGRGSVVPPGATVVYDLELVEATSAVDVAPKALVEDDVTAVPLELPQAGLITVEVATRELLKLAHRHELDGRYGQASTIYRDLVAGDAPPVLAVLGRVRAFLRDEAWDKAHALLLRFPAEPSLVWAHARMSEQRGRNDHARKLYLTLARSLDVGEPEVWLRQAVLGAREDPEQAREDVEVYLDLLTRSGTTSEVEVAALAACARAMVTGGAAEVAAEMLEALQNWVPAGVRLDTLQPVLDEIALDRVASGFVLVRKPTPLGLAERARLEGAIVAVQQGQIDAGLDTLRALRAEFPGAIDVWIALGDAYASTAPTAEGDPLHHAEHAYRTAAGLDSAHREVHARLGRLLEEAYGGRRDRDARAAYEMELAVSPNHVEVRCRYARVLQRMGEFELALTAWEDCAARVSPNSDWAAQAVLSLSALARDVPAAPDAPPLEPVPADVPEEAMLRWQKARALMARRAEGWETEAKRVLEGALAIAPDFNAARMTLASVLVESGDIAGATNVYAAVLADEPGHIWAHLERGRLLADAGDAKQAEQHLLIVVEDHLPDEYSGRRGAVAATVSSGDSQAIALASYWLARLAFEASDYDSSRRYLSLTLDQPISDPYLREIAIDLRTRLNAPRVLQQRILIGSAGVVALLGFVLLVRRWRSIDLETFLERSPRAWPEIAGVLSAIRHEVLKHNTTLLPSVADAIEAGDVEASAYAAERLFGGDNESGVIERFNGYVVKLAGIANGHGYRLALARDPIIAPMQGSMRRLSKLERQLRGLDGWHRNLAQNLREISDVLNGSGYTALGRVLSEMCVLSLDHELFQHIYHRVSQEPELQGEAPSLEIDGPYDAMPVRIFRSDLEDIAGNLFRNALEVLVRDHPLDARRVGLSIVEEVDPVTGHEHIALRFKDNALEPFTDAMLSGRYIEHGLGIALDLISRYQGSLCVESEDGWAKAVVVRLPRAESEADLTTTMEITR